MPHDPPILVVVNPVAGRTRNRTVLDALCRRISQAGWPVSVHETRGPGEAGAFARQSCRSGARALVVAGGDGTLSEVVGGLEGPGVPILVVPCGTENILAKYLGAKLDAQYLWKVLRTGREVDFDLPAINGRRFLILAGVGFDAEVVHRLQRCRQGHITHLDYFWPLWRTFWTHPFHPLSVEVDGRCIHQGPALAFVGNLPRYSIGLKILQQARPGDGLLDVCVMSCASPASLLRHAGNVLLHRHIGKRQVLYHRAKHVHLSADHPIPVQVDGDVAGCLPADIRITGARARFLVSTDWSD